MVDYPVSKVTWVRFGPHKTHTMATATAIDNKVPYWQDLVVKKKVRQGQIFQKDLEIPILESYKKCC